MPGAGLFPLTNDSSYTSLQRVADMAREGMVINRANLSSAVYALGNFDSASLDRDTARALIRFITVIPEAIRFRQIQRNFRVSLAQIPADYTMG